MRISIPVYKLVYICVYIHIHLGVRLSAGMDGVRRRRVRACVWPTCVCNGGWVPV